MATDVESSRRNLLKYHYCIPSPKQHANVMQRTNPLIKDERGDARNLMGELTLRLGIVIVIFIYIYLYLYIVLGSSQEVYQIFGSNIFCTGLLGPLPMMDVLLPWSFRMRWLTFCIKYPVFHAAMTEHNRK